MPYTVTLNSGPMLKTNTRPGRQGGCSTTPIGSCPTDKRKLGLRLSRVLEVGVPGSMDEGQMEDSGVFRVVSTAGLASKSCLAKNNVKTTWQPDQAGCWPPIKRQPHTEGIRVSTFSKQLGPEDPEGGGLRRGHCCISGSQCGLRISSKRSPGNLSEMYILRPHYQAWYTSHCEGWIQSMWVLTSPPSDDLKTTV